MQGITEKDQTRCREFFFSGHLRGDPPAHGFAGGNDLYGTGTLFPFEGRVRMADVVSSADKRIGNFCLSM